MTTSRLLSTINPHRQSSPKTPISNRRFSHLHLKTGSPPFTGLTLTKQNKPITSPFIRTTKPTPKLTGPVVLKALSDEDIQKWPDQQNIFVGTAAYALFEAAEYFLIGVALKIIINRYFSNRLCDIQLGLPYSSLGLYPLVFCRKQSPLKFARNYAIFGVLLEVTKYVVKRVRGKKDLKSSIWGGVGEGLLMALTTAAPSDVLVIGVCVFFGLLHGFKFKAKEAFKAWKKRNSMEDI